MGVAAACREEVCTCVCVCALGVTRQYLLLPFEFPPPPHPPTVSGGGLVRIQVLEKGSRFKKFQSLLMQLVKIPFLQKQVEKKIPTKKERETSLCGHRVRTEE